MSKARIETLERETAFLRGQIARMREDPGDLPFDACGNSCVCASPRGMATNSSCSCSNRKLRGAVLFWRRRAQFLQATIALMRDGDAVEQFDTMLAMLNESRAQRAAAVDTARAVLTEKA